MPRTLKLHTDHRRRTQLGSWSGSRASLPSRRNFPVIHTTISPIITHIFLQICILMYQARGESWKNILSRSWWLCVCCDLTVSPRPWPDLLRKTFQRAKSLLSVTPNLTASKFLSRLGRRCEVDSNTYNSIPGCRHLRTHLRWSRCTSSCHQGLTLCLTWTN